MKNRQHIYLVDDDTSMLEVLMRLFMREGYQLHAYSDAAAFVQSGPVLHPCVIILDMQMPVSTGLDVQSTLVRTNNTAPVVFLSGQSYPAQIVSGFKNGAVDFLFKPVDIDLLLQTVERAIAFDLAQQTTETATAHMRVRYGLLSPREKEVCLCLAQGMIRKNVAVLLGISEATLKIHKYRIYEKMAVQTSAELLKACLQLNLLTANGAVVSKNSAQV